LSTVHQKSLFSEGKTNVVFREGEGVFREKGGCYIAFGEGVSASSKERRARSRTRGCNDGSGDKGLDKPLFHLPLKEEDSLPFDSRRNSVSGGKRSKSLGPLQGRRPYSLERGNGLVSLKGKRVLSIGGLKGPDDLLPSSLERGGRKGFPPKGGMATGILGKGVGDLVVQRS